MAWTPFWRAAYSSKRKTGAGFVIEPGPSAFLSMMLDREFL